MGIGIKRTQRDYTLAFKLAVVEQVERGELTYKEVGNNRGQTMVKLTVPHLLAYPHFLPLSTFQWQALRHCECH